MNRLQTTPQPRPLFNTFPPSPWIRGNKGETITWTAARWLCLPHFLLPFNMKACNTIRGGRVVTKCPLKAYTNCTTLSWQAQSYLLHLEVFGDPIISFKGDEAKPFKRFKFRPWHFHIRFRGNHFKISLKLNKSSLHQRVMMQEM